MQEEIRCRIVPLRTKLWKHVLEDCINKMEVLSQRKLQSVNLDRWKNQILTTDEEEIQNKYEDQNEVYTGPMGNINFVVDLFYTILNGVLNEMLSSNDFSSLKSVIEILKKNKENKRALSQRRNEAVAYIKYVKELKNLNELIEKQESTNNEIIDIMELELTRDEYEYGMKKYYIENFEKSIRDQNEMKYKIKRNEISTIIQDYDQKLNTEVRCNLTIISYLWLDIEVNNFIPIDLDMKQKIQEWQSKYEEDIEKLNYKILEMKQKREDFQEILEEKKENFCDKQNKIQELLEWKQQMKEEKLLEEQKERERQATIELEKLSSSRKFRKVIHRHKRAKA